MLPPVGSEPRHWLSSAFHVLHATAWAKSPIWSKNQQNMNNKNLVSHAPLILW